MHGIIVLVGGFLLDCLLGDPHNPWHPICLIGYLISFLEKKIRKLFPKQPKGEFYGNVSAYSVSWVTADWLYCIDSFVGIRCMYVKICTSFTFCFMK